MKKVLKPRGQIFSRQGPDGSVLLIMVLFSVCFKAFFDKHVKLFSVARVVFFFL